jgi:small-conductance mechanosensitive channel
LPPVSAIMHKHETTFPRTLAARLAAMACVALLLALGSFAAGARAEAVPNELERRLAMDEDSAPVMLDGRVLFRLRGTALVPPGKRAGKVVERLRQFADDTSIPVEALQAEDDGELTRIVAGERAIMVLADLDTEGVPRRRLAEVLVADLRKAVQTYRDDRTPRVLLVHTGYAVLATLAAAAVLYGLVRLRRWAIARLRRRFAGGGAELKIQSMQLVQARQVWYAIRGLLNATITVSVLAVVYLHLSTVLGLYPWTKPLADELFQLFLQPLQVMGLAFLSALPDLTFIFVLVLVARYVLKALHLMFQGIETGAISFENFDPEWAPPTYKIVRILVIAFAVVVAYPYIPGSESQAFKGVSLFLGVIFSLGSSSVISNVIAGYTMTYRRAFRLGDRIAVGEVTGFVTETSVLVTRLRSLKNEEVVLPNSEILGKAVVNYSALARSQGLIVHTTVGIGYETPWRQVEAMLCLAAERTPALERDPPPFVLQQTLGDFCVVYEINAFTRDAAGLAGLYTVLHRNILDVFNEYGVQIMTPAYEGDPEVPKLVPREQWHLAPAPAAPGEGTPPPAG